MAKRNLTAAELYRLRSSLQVATLTALMASRRWEPGDLAFQGGTCLSLAYGSARFSEDLDFMVRGGMTLTGLEKSIERLLVLPPDIPAGLKHSVTLSKDDRNPHAFFVTLAGDSYLGAAKVKVELWSTPKEAMDQLRLMVRPIMSQMGEQSFVPVETLDEVLADKVYALGARDRIKPRDVFDLWWLKSKDAANVPELSAEALALRLRIYPRGTEEETAALWLAAAEKRLELFSPKSFDATAAFVASDLAKWLPSSWPTTPRDVAPMMDSSRESLEEGIRLLSFWQKDKLKETEVEEEPFERERRG